MNISCIALKQTQMEKQFKRELPSKQIKELLLEKQKKIGRSEIKNVIEGDICGYSIVEVKAEARPKFGGN